MQCRPALTFVVGAIFGATVVLVVPRDASGASRSTTPAARDASGSTTPAALPSVRARRRRILLMLSGERVWIKVSKAVQYTKAG